MHPLSIMEALVRYVKGGISCNRFEAPNLGPTFPQGQYFQGCGLWNPFQMAMNMAYKQGWS